MADAMATSQPKSKGFPPPVSYGEEFALEHTTVTSAFYTQVSSNPNYVAVKDLASKPPRQLTYHQLASHAQTLALKLRSLGVQPNQRVPLVVKRGVEMIVGIWAILSCGAQYVPLDGGVVPDSTIKHVIEQSEGGVVLCISETEHRIRSLSPLSTAVVIDRSMSDHHVLGADWIDLALPDSGCYVIYTSGTTGKPKGVDVTHRNVANLVCLYPGNLGIQAGMSVGQVLNISFDMAAWEILACLCNGGTLVLRGSQWEPTIEQLDVLICTPTILQKYHPAQYPNIRTVATAGEATSQDLADLWATHGTYWNCCGPTETTIVNTMSKHIAGQPISIGKPTPNNVVYILDEDHNCVPVGSPGVMWAAGYGVTRGYIGLEEKTKESYISDPFTNTSAKMYCTGDLGQWRPDGNIDILGRLDDQVKVKGFRVELDGISSSLASAPGVTRATTLFINDNLHSFIVPDKQDLGALFEHIRKLQPYYAIPSKIHQLESFPTTGNGKIDKKILKAIVINSEMLEKPTKALLSVSSKGTLVDKQSISPSTVTEVSFEKETFDLEGNVPEKSWDKPFRGIRYRILIVYRTLFSILTLINIGALIALLVTHAGSQWLATLTAANLVTAVLVRQDTVINLLYTTFCSVPKAAPLWLRRRCAKIYHLGGVHSGAAICATTWLLADTFRSTAVFATNPTSPKSLATLVISWMLSVLCCTMIGFAYPTFRKKYHNRFECIHRFLGWTALGLFWIRTVLSVYDSIPDGEDLGQALIRTPGFWILGVATCSIASSWFWLRKVRVDAIPLSDHAILLNFDYTFPVNGSFTRISTRPLLEWHSFATIPQPEPSQLTSSKGYSLVVSNAGDWTKNCIRNPPTHLWVRGVPTCGVMRIATLFNRVVIIATGSGIGPLLGHINQPSCPTQLIWSTPSPEKTFGKGVLDTIRRTIPDAVIHDTKVKGRPDLVKMGYNLAKSFGAEAIIIIANEKITKKVVYGLETRGVAAYGAIWDS